MTTAGPPPTSPAGHQVTLRAPWAPALPWFHHMARAVAAHQTWFAVVGVAAVAAAVAVAVARWRNGVRVSANRYRAVMVPTESFNPPIEELLQFASMIAQARTPRRLFTSRRRRAVRVRMPSMGSTLAFVIEAPGWMTKTVQAALPDEAELHPLAVLQLPVKAVPAPKGEDEDDDGEGEDGEEGGDRRGGAEGGDGEDDLADGEDLVDDEEKLVRAP
jgi:hypothetical protein